ITLHTDRRLSPTMMNRRYLLSLAIAAVALPATASAQAPKLSSRTVAANASVAPYMVMVTPHESDRRVDITVDGKPFTSYIWPTNQKKPILYPITSDKGTVVTRGFPLEPRAGERTDHPHHAGLWFNYGNVNGLDFWNNSDSIKASQASKYGTIVHRGIKATHSGAGEGTLDVIEEWVTSTNVPLLRENTRFIFRARDGVRTIDRITQLTALDSTVNFDDNKEGVIGMRVARQLEQPSMTPEKYTDASGKVTNVAKLDTAGIHGWYTSSEGKEGDAVWGTRGKWAMLTGDVNGAPITLAMLDHPKNVGFPTYWHARGYGLFAANPLGQKAMSNGKEELNFKLAPKASVTFRHQVLILDGKATPADVEKYYARFTH
ncbi:MAG: PmoA family protein, partial [bacterium]